MRRQLVTLERREQAPYGSAALLDTFVPVATIWAALGATRGSVIQGDVQILDAVTHRLVLRWVDPATWTHVRAGDRRFRRREVVDPDGRQREIEVLLEEEHVVRSVTLVDGGEVATMDGEPLELVRLP